MKVNEGQLKKIIREAILEALEERGTNMESLYHFTSLGGLYGILTNGYFKPSAMQTDIRNGIYTSFTRHKSNLEGFARARGLNARIEVDGRALSRIRGGSVEPFEYYSPMRRGAKYGITPDTSAKSKYANARKYKMHGESEYMSQAEESFTSKQWTIPIKGVIIRADIDASAFVNDNLRFDLLKSIVQKLMGTQYKDIVFIYESSRDFNLQTGNCVKLEDYYRQMQYSKVVEEGK